VDSLPRQQVFLAPECRTAQLYGIAKIEKIYSALMSSKSRNFSLVLSGAVMEAALGEERPGGTGSVDLILHCDTIRLAAP
jgi:hypothetical protein